MQFDDSSRRVADELIDQLFDHVQQIESKPVVDWHSGAVLQEAYASSRAVMMPGHWRN